jgi:hypothetical protein
LIIPVVKTFPAFTTGQRDLVHRLLAAKVAVMMGRKLEEADWTEVYCRAKNIPPQHWSNLYPDVVHNGLGVELKMLCYRSDTEIEQACGETLMHPAATRSIRIPRGTSACGARDGGHPTAIQRMDRASDRESSRAMPQYEA